MSAARSYAEGTTVSVENSKAELDRLLSRHGATQRGVVSDDEAGAVAIMFVLRGGEYRLTIPLPTLAAHSPKASREPKGWAGWDADRRAGWVRVQWEQACRERFRAVVLLVKAKLELVRLGVSSIEREFMADMILPNRRTVGEIVAEQIGAALAGGPAPRLLGTGT